MAWIVEKFRIWSDCGGDVESRFTKDELLTNVSLYWFNQNITSSTRLYYEAMGPFAKTSPRGPVKARTDFLSFSCHWALVCRALLCYLPDATGHQALHHVCEPAAPVGDLSIG